MTALVIGLAAWLTLAVLAAAGWCVTRRTLRRRDDTGGRPVIVLDNTSVPHDTNPAGRRIPAIENEEN